MAEDKCTYCGKELGSKYTFSYGIPGVTRIYGCNRWVCKLNCKLQSKIKVVLWPVIDNLYKWATKYWYNY